LPVDILKGLPIYGYSPIGIHNSILADPVFQFEPWRMFLKEAIISGNLPFWNNLNGAGVPFLANPITSVFSPLNIFYFFLPPSYSLILMAFLKILIFGAGVYMYLRVVKISKEISIMGSLIAPSGYFLLWLSWPQTNVYLFFPFILVLIEIFKRKITFVNFVILSLIFFLAYLGGHPETYFQIALVGLMYCLFRYPRSWKIVSIYCLAIITGTLLSSFQLIPFLEYLHVSYALQVRSVTPHDGLPLATLAFNFFPYLFGAPHIKFYKPFPGTNFQEAVGGYVGLIFIVLIISKIKLIIRDSYLKTWLLIAIVSFLLSYSIPVISDIVKSTPLGINANARMVGTLGFSIIMMGCMLLAKFQAKQTLGKINGYFHLLVIALFIIIAIFISSSNLQLVFSSLPTAQAKFVPVFTTLLAITVISSICFYLILQVKNRLSKYFYISALTIVIVIQSTLFFVSYNPFVKSDLYYPSNRVIEILQQKNLPMLNVGSVNLSPDINMAYGIKSIENYDAMDISWYKRAFDGSFPDKNRWGNVDSVKVSSLKRFGVGIVLSDYDINLEKVSVVKESDNVHSLTKKNIVSIIGDGKILKQIRFLPATYNRKNSCNLFMTIRKGNEVLQKSKLHCDKLYNGMFYTVTIEPELLIKQTQYQIEFEVEGDGVGLFGDKDSPYLDVLFDSGKNYFDKLYDKDQIVIYEVPDSNVIETTAKIGRVSDESNKLTFVAFSKKQTQVNVKKTYYPGWQLKVNDANVPIEGRNPFMIFKVSEGQSRIELKYVPYSFYLGLIISGLTLFVIVSISILLIFRNLRSWKSGTRFYNYIYKKTVKIPAYFHIYLFGLSFLISVIGFVFVCAIIPAKFVVPETTAINWLTVNHYPKQQDLYLFALGFPGIIISSIVIWTILICKKK